MIRPQTIAALVLLLSCAVSASADVPPNCGPNKIPKNALECVCVQGTTPQSDGSCKPIPSGLGGSPSPQVLPGTGPTIPLEPTPSPSCGTGMCGPSVFNVVNGLDNDPEFPGNGPFGTEDLNVLQQKILLRNTIKVPELLRSESDFSVEQDN